MEALKLSFPKTISFPAKAAASVPVEGQAAFASLLESLSVEMELESPSEELAPAEELLENLESLLAVLQELPIEEQTPEQQELQYAILQLEAGYSEISLSSSSQLNGKTGMAADAEKLIGLLEKIQQKLQVLSDKFTTEFADSPFFKGAEEKKNSPDVSGLALISKQLDELVSLLERKPQVEGVKSVKDLTRFSNETLKPVNELPKVPIEVQGVLSKAEAVELQASGKFGGVEELQSPKLVVEGKPLQETNVQPTASMVADTAKNAGSQIRTEANAPAAPFVRLSNLLEDLGGMLKSSMRMAETAEGMKMRVNIFPEHLGHLEILLTSTNGKLAAQIMASTPMAKEALELQLNQLRASLVQQGVAVEKIEVLQQESRSPFGQAGNQAEQRFSQSQQQNGTAGRNKNSYLQQEEEEAAKRQPSVGQLMKVDYTV